MSPLKTEAYAAAEIVIEGAVAPPRQPLNIPLSHAPVDAVGQLEVDTDSTAIGKSVLYIRRTRGQRRMMLVPIQAIDAPSGGLMGIANLCRNIRTNPASQHIVFRAAGYRVLGRGSYKNGSVHNRA